MPTELKATKPGFLEDLNGGATRWLIEQLRPGLIDAAKAGYAQGQVAPLGPGGGPSAPQVVGGVLGTLGRWAAEPAASAMALGDLLTGKRELPRYTVDDTGRYVPSENGLPGIDPMMVTEPMLDLGMLGSVGASAPAWSGYGFIGRKGYLGEFGPWEREVLDMAQALVDKEFTDRVEFGYLHPYQVKKVSEYSTDRGKRALSGRGTVVMPERVSHIFDQRVIGDNKYPSEMAETIARGLYDSPFDISPDKQAPGNTVFRNKRGKYSDIVILSPHPETGEPSVITAFQRPTKKTHKLIWKRPKGKKK